MVDCFDVGPYSFAMLIIQSESMNVEVDKPEIIQNFTITEITDQDVWQNRSISKIDWEPPKELVESIRKTTL